MQYLRHAYGAGAVCLSSFSARIIGRFITAVDVTVQSNCDYYLWYLRKKRFTMSYHRIKMILYISQTGFGLFLGWLAVRGLNSASIVDVLAGAVLLAVSAALILFGCLTYYLRDDPDVWR